MAGAHPFLCLTFNEAGLLADGFVAGALPSAGASLESFLSNSPEKSAVDHEAKTFGKGDPPSVIAPEVDNNAASGGASVPRLALGAPGSGTTAVVLRLNITPGPILFFKSPDIVWGLIAALFVGTFVLRPLNFPHVRLFTHVLLVPMRILMPVVAMISFVGIYAIAGSSFDVMLMVGFGILGWVLCKLDVPPVPIIPGNFAWQRGGGESASRDDDFRTWSVHSRRQSIGNHHLDHCDCGFCPAYVPGATNQASDASEPLSSGWGVLVTDNGWLLGRTACAS